MQTATIEGAIRKPSGRHANERLRKAGMIPAIVYGHGEEPEMLSLSNHDLTLALGHGAHVLDVMIEGKKTQFLLKEVQYDHLQKDVLHVDLMRISKDEKVRVNVAIEYRGEPHGVHEGGDFIAVMTDIDVECPVAAIPSVLKINVEHMGLGATLHVSDVTFPEGVTTHHKPEDVVATVRAKRGVGAGGASESEEGAEGEAATAEPEVIGRGGQESESED